MKGIDIKYAKTFFKEMREKYTPGELFSLGIAPVVKEPPIQLKYDKPVIIK